MKNLAGVRDCDDEIRKELKEAGIRVVSVDRSKGEVPCYFRFSRAGYYWVVVGDVPLEIANEMYATEVGEENVRVAGHYGCPPPEEWAFPKDEVLFELGVYKKPCEEYPYGDSPTYGELSEMCNSGKIVAPRFVQSYHIDSQEGLKLFADTIKKHKLM